MLLSSFQANSIESLAQGSIPAFVSNLTLAGPDLGHEIIDAHVYNLATGIRRYEPLKQIPGRMPCGPCVGLP